MVLTLVVACFIALAQWLVPHFSPFLLQPFLIGVPFATLGPFSAWAILGTKHPKAGILSVLLVAPIFGFGGEALLSDGGEELADWITATMTEALVLIVSLSFEDSAFQLGGSGKVKQPSWLKRCMRKKNVARSEVDALLFLEYRYGSGVVIISRIADYV